MNKHTIARAAVSAGLAVAMTLGSVAPATMAWAATNDGVVTIQKRADGDGTALVGYQIFKADVVDGTIGKVASNLEWASDTAKEAVETATGKTFATAQDAADELAKLTTSGEGYVLGKDDTLNKVAAYMRENQSNPVAVTPGVQKTGLSTGYWLFLTTKDSTNSTTDKKKVDQSGTSPIFALVGGNALTISQKATIPTVDKWVKNDKSNSDWSKAADSQVDQQLEYKLVGTVAQNVATYGTYYYKFTDNLSAGLAADLDTVVVKVKNGETETAIDASKYTKKLKANDDGTSTLTVEFQDLKSAGVTIDSNSVVNVYYSAKLDPKKAYKLAGEANPNTVTLTYSNNPGTDSNGDTTPAEAKDYTYKLSLTKVDSKVASKKLPGAKFTIQATTPDEGAGSAAKYVQENGSLGSDAHEFVTDKNGEISVKGLDAGTYTVVETESPSGYNRVAKFTFTITPDWTTDANGVATGLKEVTVADNSEAVDSSVVDNGKVSLTVKDKEGSGLPLTGQAGIGVTLAAGGAVLAIGVYRVVRSRREQDAE